MVSGIEAVRRGIEMHWGNMIAGQFACRIIDALVERETPEGATLRVREILKMLEVEDLSSEVLSALTILSQSSFAVLRSGGELVDDKNERHWLSPVEFQGVLDAGSVVHPVTQEMVHDALQKVFPVFVVTADLVAEKAL